MIPEHHKIKQLTAECLSALEAYRKKDRSRILAEYLTKAWETGDHHARSEIRDALGIEKCQHVGDYAL